MSIVVGTGSHLGNPLTTPIQPTNDEAEEAYRRVEGTGTLFAADVQSSTNDVVGVFKAEKGAPEVSSPFQDQTELMCPLVFPVPVSEGDDHGGAMSVYQKPVLSHPQQELVFTATDGAIEVLLFCKFDHMHSNVLFLPFFCQGRGLRVCL